MRGVRKVKCGVRFRSALKIEVRQLEYAHASPAAYDRAGFYSNLGERGAITVNFSEGPAAQPS